MQVDSVIRTLLDHSGISDRGVSAALGKSPAWAGLTAQRGRDPKLSTVCAVADIAGVDVVLIDRETGERLGIVEPPPRG